jgi:glycerate kinase
MDSPRRVVVAATAFKGSLSSVEATASIARGIRQVWPGAELDEAPVADGGDGSLEALEAAGAVSEFHPLEVRGPLGQPVEARWAALHTRQAFVESAAACGLRLLDPAGLDPWRASTHGVGQLLLAALEAGWPRVVVGLGGSATLDGGAGLLQVLGYRLLDAAGRELPPGGGALFELARIVPPAERPWVGREILLAADVRAPLLGPRGAARLYGPQKGAHPAMVADLEQNLTWLARRLAEDLGWDAGDLPGSGAAGGLGAGMMAGLGARVVGGADWILEQVGLAARLEGADLVVTGEGRADLQSLEGKAVQGVAEAAARAGVPLALLAGLLGPGAGRLGARWLRAVEARPGVVPRSVEAASRLRHAAHDLALEILSESER